jgi:hypothetical protein
MRTPAPKLLVLAFAVIALALVPVAFAAKGGNGGQGGGGKPGGGSGTSASLSASPNPAPAWSSFQGSGCGYTTGKQVNVNVDSPYWNAGFPVAVDSSGCISFMFWVDGPGTYIVRTSQNLSGTKQTQLASVSLRVV